MEFIKLDLAFTRVKYNNWAECNLTSCASLSSWLASDWDWIPIVTVGRRIALSDIAKLGVGRRAGAGSVGRAGLGEQGWDWRKAGSWELVRVGGAGKSEGRKDVCIS